MTAPAPIPCPTCRADLRPLLTIRGATCPACSTRHTYRRLATIDPYLPPLHLLWSLFLGPGMAAAIVGLGHLAAGAGWAPRTNDFNASAFLALCLIPLAVFARVFYQPLSRHGRGFAMALALIPAGLATILILIPQYAALLAIVYLFGSPR